MKDHEEFLSDFDFWNCRRTCDREVTRVGAGAWEDEETTDPWEEVTKPIASWRIVLRRMLDSHTSGFADSTEATG